ncbi:MAG: AraC family transcriptional regulator [Bacteroidia bacterium]|nr:AraC family transcriptional regulator [Bacteroidia bacterium]
MRVQLSIKDMIGRRCISTVERILLDFQVSAIRVSLGSAEFDCSNYPLISESLKLALEKEGFKLVKNKEEKILEQIKVAVLEMIYYGNNLNTIIRNSDYLSDKIGQPYSYLSKLFSEFTGQTLEKYIILVKIERVKELLAYNEMTLSEISYQMGYSSVQYLSTQFKQVTGFSVSDYKNMEQKPRIPLDELLN